MSKYNEYYNAIKIEGRVENLQLKNIDNCKQ